MTNKRQLFGVELSADQLEKMESIGPILNTALGASLPSQKDACCPPTANCCGPNTETDDATPSAPPSSCCSPNPAPDSGSTKTDNADSTACCVPRTPLPQVYLPVAKKQKNGVCYVDTTLSARDKIGTVKARMGKSRMAYAVEPGLYAVGSPDKKSAVLVTANYKLTFDHLRSQLQGRHLWILVLNTYGINVWCAAGKGTFGTDELIKQINETDLADKVTGRKIVVPQLGAPGVAGHIVKKETGFTVAWGPINAEDLVSYLNNGLVANNNMRQKKFPFVERLTLLPIELRPALKTAFIAIGATAPLAAIFGPGAYMNDLVLYAVLFAFYVLGGVVAAQFSLPCCCRIYPGAPFHSRVFSPAF